MDLIKDKMKTVYLAGTITGDSYNNATEWRDAAVKRLESVGLRGLSPMRGKEYLEGLEDIADSYEAVMSKPQGITTRDRFDVANCDLVLVNLLNTSKVSIGTMIELGWADAYRKPIVLVMEDGNIHDHAMVRQLCGFTVDTLDEGVAIAVKILAAYM